MWCQAGLRSHVLSVALTRKLAYTEMLIMALVRFAYCNIKNISELIRSQRGNPSAAFPNLFNPVPDIRH